MHFDRIWNETDLLLPKRIEMLLYLFEWVLYTDFVSGTSLPATIYTIFHHCIINNNCIFCVARFYNDSAKKCCSKGSTWDEHIKMTLRIFIAIIFIYFFSVRDYCYCCFVAVIVSFGSTYTYTIGRFIAEPLLLLLQ